jgi:hypothetical protein
MPTARVLYCVIESHGDESPGEHDDLHGWALLGLSPSGRDNGMREFVRVDFRQTSGGRIEDGDVTIEKVALARFDDTRGPTDEDGTTIDRDVLMRALSESIAADFERDAARAGQDPELEENEEPTQP